MKGEALSPLSIHFPDHSSLMLLGAVPNLFDLRLLLGFPAIALLTALAFYIVRKLRDRVLKEDSPTTGDLKEFEEIASQGDISPEEFRTIKTALAARMVGGSKEPPPDFKSAPSEGKPKS